MTDDGKVIVIADDNDDYLTCLEIKFRSRGFVPLLARNGQDALDLIRTRQVDAVLTDVDMPLITGIELLGRVHDICPALPVFITTGNAGYFPKAEAMRRGAAGYFPKPCVGRDMVLEIQEIVERRHLRLGPGRHPPGM